MAVNWDDFTPAKDQGGSDGVDWSQFSPADTKAAGAPAKTKPGLFDGIGAEMGRAESGFSASSEAVLGVDSSPSLIDKAAKDAPVRGGPPVTVTFFDNVKSQYESASPKQRAEMVARKDLVGQTAQYIDSQYKVKDQQQASNRRGMEGVPSMGDKLDNRVEKAGVSADDFTNQFNTKLSPMQEKLFQKWALENSRIGDLRDYDMRGAWLDMQKGDVQQAGNGHFPDTYKKPNHPTFSTDSKYSTGNTIGGTWSNEDGQDVFVPSSQNLKYRNRAQLADYFNKQEPNAKLHMQGESANTFTDLAGKAVSGLIEVPKGFVGLVDLAGTPVRAAYEAISGEKAGTVTQALSALGVDFAEAQRILSEEWRSTAGVRSDLKVEQAFDKNMGEGLKALGSNPMRVIGSALESLPGMLSLAGGTRVAATRIFGKAAERALAGGATAAEATLAGKAAVEASMPRLSALSSALEGAQTAGSQAAAAAADGKLDGRQAAAAALAGMSTAVIGMISNKVGGKLGLEDSQAHLGATGLRTSTTDSALGVAKEAGKGFVKEGLLEEFPQSAGEQVFQNFGDRKPLGEGVGQAALEGGLVGGLMGSTSNVASSSADLLRARLADTPAARADTAQQNALDAWQTNGLTTGARPQQAAPQAGSPTPAAQVTPDAGPTPAGSPAAAGPVIETDPEVRRIEQEVDRHLYHRLDSLSDQVEAPEAEGLRAAGRVAGSDIDQRIQSAIRIRDEAARVLMGDPEQQVTEEAQRLAMADQKNSYAIQRTRESGGGSGVVFPAIQQQAEQNVAARRASAEKMSEQARVVIAAHGDQLARINSQRVTDADHAYLTGALPGARTLEDRIALLPSALQNSYRRQLDQARAAAAQSAQTGFTSFTPAGSVTEKAGLAPIVLPNAPTVAQTQAAAPAVPAPAAPAPAAEDKFGLSSLMEGLNGPATETLAPATSGSEVAGNLSEGGVATAGSVHDERAGKLADSSEAVAGPTEQAPPDAVAAGKQPAAVKDEPYSIWAGRRGDGYENREQAQAALPRVTRAKAGLDWKVEQQPDGRFRLAGYRPANSVETKNDGRDQASTVAPASPAVAVAESAPAVPAAPAAPAKVSGGESAQAAASARVALQAPKGEIERVAKSLAGAADPKSRATVRGVVAPAKYTPAQKTASAVARALGKTFTVLDVDHEGYQGFIDKLGGKHIFVSSKSAASPMTVVIHEGLHGLKDDVRKRVEDKLRSYFNEGATEKFKKEYSYGDEELSYEIPAKIAEALAAKRDFWVDVRDRLGNADFIALGRAILDKFNELIGRADKNESDHFLRTYVKDVKAARDTLAAAIAEAMNDTSTAEEKPAAKPGKSEKPVASRAYHGSPHRFERFDLSKMGTGEGAQMYGWGQYFADHADVAKSYVPRSHDQEQAMLKEYSNAEAKNDYAAMEVWEAAMLHKTLPEIREQFSADAGYGPEFSAAVDRFENWREKNPATGGQLYGADIPDDAIPKMLLWDKPLSEHPDGVRKSVEKLWKEKKLPGNPDDQTGHEVHAYAMAAFRHENSDKGYIPVSETQKGAAGILNDAGIPGLRYLDGNSRSDGEGTYNTVVWDQDLLDRISDTIEIEGKPIKPSAKADVAKADSIEKETGFRPYTSEGQVEVPVELPKFSIKRVEQGKYGVHEPTGLPLNKNGTVTLYFPTTNESARAVAQERVLRGHNESARRVYLTNESSASKVMENPAGIEQPVGGANVLLQIDPSYLHLDQEHEDGRKDFFVQIAEGLAFAKKIAQTKLFSLNKSRTEGISKTASIATIQAGVKSGLADYLALSVADRRARLREARATLKSEHNVGTLLGENGKLEKTRVGDYGLTYDGKSVASLGLGLASAQKITDKLSSCPNSSRCEALCLGETSGQNKLYGGSGQFRAGPRLSQYLKTEALVMHPEDFAIVLHAEIARFAKRIAKDDYQPAIRLNVTSDFIPRVYAPIIDAFPGVMFYDYTKLNSESIAKNHHLTYSSDGATQSVNGSVVGEGSNWDRMVKKLDSGANVAMAFSSKTDMPKYVFDEASGQTYQVWNGDNYDARFLDPKPGEPGNEFDKGMIIGLTNKDRTGSPETAAEKNDGFFVDYDKARDGDTLTIRDHKSLSSSKIAASRARSPLGFYSELAEKLQAGPNAAPVDQWKAYIKGLSQKGVKQDEIEWTGITDWLDMQKGKVSKDAVLEYVNGNGVQVEETTLSDSTVRKLPSGWSVVDYGSGTIDPDMQFVVYDADENEMGYGPDEQTAIENSQDRDGYADAPNAPKYGQYTLPGGTNYREVLLRLPTKPMPSYEQIRDFAKKWVQQEFDRDGSQFADDQQMVDAMKDDIWAWNDLWSSAAAKEFGLKDQVIRPYGGDTDAEFSASTYKSKHWDQPDILAHIRLNDRTDADGKRVLFVEEVQSDWGQEGKKKGFISDLNKVPDDFYAEPAPEHLAGKYKFVSRRRSEPDVIYGAGNTEYEAIGKGIEAWKDLSPQNRGVGVPAAPFVTKTEGWLNLALKRIAAIAAGEGYDRVAFVNGEQSASRYDLSKQVDQIDIPTVNKDGSRAVRIDPKDGRSFRLMVDKNGKVDGHGSASQFTGKTLDEVIGKEAADKVMRAEVGTILTGLDLKVGGEGMKTFYDKIVPNAVRAMVKKLGGGEMSVVDFGAGNPYAVEDGDDNVLASFRTREDAEEYMRRGYGQVLSYNASESRVALEAQDLKQHGFDVTPAMREKVAQGLPLFSKARQTETPEFKKWFGDSNAASAVNPNTGMPVESSREPSVTVPTVMYHTTRNDFSAFEVGRKTKNSGTFGDWETERAAIFVTPDLEASQAYGKDGGKVVNGARVMPVYIRAENPLDLTGGMIDYRTEREFEDAGLNPKWLHRFDWTKFDDEDGKHFVETAKSLGYDSVIFNDENPETGDSFEAWAVFSPEQIKSATGNNGNFDPANPNIIASRAPKKGNYLFGKDDLGRVRFEGGAHAYRQIANVTSNLLSKVAAAPMNEDLQRYYRAMRAEIDKSKRVAVEASEKMKGMSKAEASMISDYIEKEMAAGVTPPADVMNTAAWMQNIMSATSKELVSLKMLSTEAQMRWENKYLPRFYEKNFKQQVSEWVAAAKKLAQRPGVLPGVSGKSGKGRGEFVTVPVAQLPVKLADGWEIRDDKYDPAKSTKVTIWRDWSKQRREAWGEIRDARFRFLMGHLEARRDIAMGRMYRAIASDAGLSSDTQLEGFEAVPKTYVPGTSILRYGDLAGKFVRKDVIDALREGEAFQSSDMLKLYREALALWKEGKTALNPVSHVNNIAGNVVVAHMAGVSMWDAHKYLGAAIDMVKGHQMVKDAIDAGLFGDTFTMEDLGKNLPDDLRQFVMKTRSPIRRGVENTLNILTLGLRSPLSKAYNFEDKFFRYLVYRDARQRGLTSEASAEHALNYIFDYSGMPKAVRIARDTALPFVSWTYKFIPVLARTALEYPWRVALPVSMLYGLNAMSYIIASAGDDDDWLDMAVQYIHGEGKAYDLETSEREDLPDYMKSSRIFPKTIRLGTDELTNLPLFWDISRMVPGGDLGDFKSNAGGMDFAAQLTPSGPLFSAYSALFDNVDPWNGKEMTKSTDRLSERAAKRAKYMYQLLAPATAVGNYHLNRIMEAAAQKMETTITAGPFEWTGFDRGGLPVQPKYAAMQTFGVKVKPVDLEKQADIRKGTSEKELRELKAEDRANKRLLNNGAISDEEFESRRDAIREKQDLLKQGLTVDGDER